MRIAIWATGLVMALTAVVVAATEGEVEYRQHTMKAVGGHMQAAVDILRQKVPHNDHMSLHADALSALSEIAPTLFPYPQSGRTPKTSRSGPPRTNKAPIWNGATAASGTPTTPTARPLARAATCAS